jgi:PAS domain S-box-containing protein
MMNDDNMSEEVLLKNRAEQRQHIDELVKADAGVMLPDEAVRESESRYHAMVDAFDGLIYVCSQDYRIEFMNQRLIDRTGYDGTGGLCHKVLHNLEQVCPWCVNERVWRGETVRWEIESPKDHRWYYVSNSPIVHPDGTMSKQSLIMDITERKLSEEALHKSEAKYRLLAQKMNDVIGMMDLNLKLTYVSPSIEKMAGFTPEECMQMDPSEMMTPESLARAAEVLSDELEREKIEGADPQRTIKLELEYYRKNGSALWLETVASIIRDDTGRAIGIHSVSRDITERRQAEEERSKLLAELERSNKDLEHFADVVAHDLQEPLRVISSFIQLLSRRYGDKLDQKAREYIEFAVKGSNRMQRMVKDLLSYSRIVTQKRAAVLADTDSVIDEVMANLQLAISDSGAIVTRDALPLVRADQSQLIQLFQNLVSNAIKFRGEEPLCIHISANKIDDEWVFSVRDNGIGIEPEYFERIFVLFERVHAWEIYQGNGIGLALCKRIVGQLGGRIWLESQPGRGTTFYFSLKEGGTGNERDKFHDRTENDITKHVNSTRHGSD